MTIARFTAQTCGYKPHRKTKVSILAATFILASLCSSHLAAAPDVSRHGAAANPLSSATGDHVSSGPEVHAPLPSDPGVSRPDTTSRGDSILGLTQSGTIRPGTPPDLSIGLGDGGGAVAPGGFINYFVAAANSGSQSATGVTVAITVPDGTTFDPASSSQNWVCPTNNPGSICTLAVGGIPAGGFVNTLYTVIVDSPAPAGFETISATATIVDDGSQGPDPNPANNTITTVTPVDAAPDLSLSNQATSNVTVPGGTASFMLGIANIGNQDATGVTVGQLVPDSTMFLPAASTSGWDCVPDAGAGSFCTLALGTLSFGGSTQASFVVEVSDPVANGVATVESDASVTDDGASGADQNPADNDASASVPILLDAVFVDGFESGDFAAWSDTVP